MSYTELLARNKRRRHGVKITAITLAALQALAAIYFDTWMILFALYHLWLSQFPKDVWDFQSRSDAVAAAIAIFAGIVVLSFSLPYFPIVYIGWYLTWLIYKSLIKIVASDCYWCYLKKPRDQNMHCLICDHISFAKTQTPLKQHWRKQHNEDDSVFKTICDWHSWTKNK
jgi:hypothetical protein